MPPRAFAALALGGSIAWMSVAGAHFEPDLPVEGYRPVDTLRFSTVHRLAPQDPVTPSERRAPGPMAEAGRSSSRRRRRS